MSEKLKKIIDENIFMGVWGGKPMKYPEMMATIHKLKINCLVKVGEERFSTLYFFVDSVKDEQKLLKAVIPHLSGLVAYDIIHIDEVNFKKYTEKKKTRKFSKTFQALEWLVKNRSKEIIFNFKDEDNDCLSRYRFNDETEEFEYCEEFSYEGKKSWTKWYKDYDNLFKCPQYWFNIREYLGK